MADDDKVIGARTHDRSAPAAADAIAFTGGLGIAVGVLLLSIEGYSRGHGRTTGIALFAVLIVVGYFALGLLPRETHPAAVALIVAGVPGTIGWWLLPHAHRFADVRPFLILTIVAWAGFWLVPRTRGRTIFVAAALIVLWLWVLGEVAGNDAYSAAPVPSPPAHTTFSLSALQSDVTIADLDTTSFLYPTARLCDRGNGFACDSLYRQAPPGSDFQQFADTCGGAQPAGSGGRCAYFEGGFSSPTPFPGGTTPFDELPGSGAVLGTGAHDKSLEIGIVSLLFGIAYVGALWAFDRRHWRGLGAALVIPGLLALFTGTEVLGNAAHHAWVGGLLTFLAGVGFALVGDVGRRRFTAWAGAVFAAVGVYTFAADVTNFKDAFEGTNAKLVRPALITIAFGTALVAFAWLVASLRSRYPGAAGSGPPAVPSRPPPVQPAPADPSSFPTWQPPPPRGASP
jgi:hypothetical protein